MNDTLTLPTLTAIHANWTEDDFVRMVSEGLDPPFSTLRSSRSAMTVTVEPTFPFKPSLLATEVNAGDTYRLIIILLLGGALILCILQYACRYRLRKEEEEKLNGRAPIASIEDDDESWNFRIYVLPMPGAKIVEAQPLFGTVAASPIHFIDEM